MQNSSLEVIGFYKDHHYLKKGCILIRENYCEEGVTIHTFSAFWAGYTYHTTVYKK